MRRLASRAKRMLGLGSRPQPDEPDAQDPEARRLAAVRELHQHERQQNPAYKHWGYKNVFAKGFIGVRGAEPELPRDRWLRLRLGEWHFAIDPEVEYREAAADRCAVLILGHAFAPAHTPPENSPVPENCPVPENSPVPELVEGQGPLVEGPQRSTLRQAQGPDLSVATRRDAVAQRILEAAQADLAAGASRTNVDAVVTRLSGRFVAFVLRGDELDVYGDPMATRACYYLDQGNIRVAATLPAPTDPELVEGHQRDAPFANTTAVPHPNLPGSTPVPERIRALAPAVASHTALLAHYAGGLTNKESRWALTHPDYADEFGRWLPGLITAHDHVRQVSANCRLTIAASETAHRRFFPPRGYLRVERTPEAAFPEFRDELRQQVRNWIATHREVSLPLTSGRDSRAILVAGLVDLQDAGAITFTYHPFHVPQKSTHTDLDIAGRVSAAAGLPHLVIDVRNVKRGSPFDVLYKKTFSSYARYENLAAALYVNIPAKAATLFGVGGGIVTGMFKNTEDQRLTAETLARKFTASKFADSPDLHRRLEQWLAYTEFDTDRLGGHSIYDLFHWEHRMSKWGAEGYLEYDLATVPAPVLNSRHLLLTALSLPEDARKAKVLYDLLEQTEPPTATAGP